MGVEPLHGEWIPAPHFRDNRNRQKWGRVIFLGTHTAEGGSSAAALGGYFQRTTRLVSSHCGIGQSGEYAEYVRYLYTAWTMNPVNDDTDNCEIMGFAAWSRDEWLKQTKMLDTFAHWLAWRSEVRNIPLRVLSAADAKAGRPGILMHRTVTAAWPGESTHEDPGPNFPWDYVLNLAKEIGGSSVSYPTPKTNDVYLSKLHVGQMDSDSVWQVQNALRKLGYDVPLTGDFDKKTLEERVRQLFNAAGITVNIHNDL
jgi:N-acetylmuramoyl-L-alanine amidase